MINVMKLDDEKIYLKQDLVKYLEFRGLPHSYPTILRYEKRGVIPSPRMNIKGTEYLEFTNKWRVYTGKTIKDIADLIEKDIAERG